MAEGRVLWGADAGNVGNALGQHADKRPAGGVALAVKGKLRRGKMVPARLDHAFFEGCWPSCHAIIKICLRLRPRQCARAVTIAHRFVSDYVIFIRGDHLALLPDRREYLFVGVDCVAVANMAGLRYTNVCRES